MNNKAIAAFALGFALLIGFAAGRFTASPKPQIKDTDEVTAEKPKPTTTKRTTFKRPSVSMRLSDPAPEPQAEPADTNNRSDRGRGKFDPVAYTAMMKERAVAERTALFNNVGLAPAQQQEFDDLVNTMNVAFAQRPAKLLALMQDGKQLSPEMNYKLLHEYSSTMMYSYEMMNRIMPADWREKAGKDFNMRNFMDPALRMATRGYRGGTGGGPPPPR
jgi:hypothetical protein